MTDKLNIVQSVKKKPIATDELIQYFETVDDIEGNVFTGFPIIPALEERFRRCNVGESFKRDCIIRLN